MRRGRRAFPGPRQSTSRLRWLVQSRLDGNRRPLRSCGTSRHDGKTLPVLTLQKWLAVLYSCAGKRKQDTPISVYGALCPTRQHA